MSITFPQPHGLVRSPAFSHVAVVPPSATTVYLGGQNGVDDSGRLVSHEIAGQAVRALENAEVALQAAGATLNDVVQWLILFDEHADPTQAYAAIAPKLARDGAPPLVTAAGVAGLGGPGALIDIGAVAAIDAAAAASSV
jgi:enamine deaminase RidA (YjgF/YER057c/UK114 family)